MVWKGLWVNPWELNKRALPHAVDTRQVGMHVKLKPKSSALFLISQIQLLFNSFPIFKFSFPVLVLISYLSYKLLFLFVYIHFSLIFVPPLSYSSLTQKRFSVLGFFVGDYRDSMSYWDDVTSRKGEVNTVKRQPTALVGPG